MRAPREPFDTLDAWRGEALEGRTDWWETLDDDALMELDRALAAARAAGKPLDALTRADFPLERLAGRIEGWQDELDRGRGFVLIRGIPVGRYSTHDCELLFWGLGLYLGRAVSQNTQGDLLGHVRDTGEDPNARGVRLYRTRAEQDFHTDCADLIGLMCLQGAKSGGVSRIVSSVTVFNELLRQAPELVPTLFEPFPFDKQGQERPGEPGWFELPICRLVDGRLGTFFIPWYIRESQALPDAPRLTEAQARCVALIETIANDPRLYLDMHFEPGDIQLLRNSAILHKRTAYEDWPEPDRKRHLLRLWLASERVSGSDARLNRGIARG